MRNTFILLAAFLLLLPLFPASAQTETFRQLIDEGIALHDKGDYQGALAKYDQVLALDKDNLDGLAEKALTLNAMQHYEEAKEYAQRAIAAHPGNKALKLVYVTLANTYDQMKQPEKALATYDEGLKLFPDFYQLHFNKGVTLSGMERFDESILCFQQDISYSPRHASGHYALTKMLKYQKERIPTLLAGCRFLLLEPEGQRAESVLAIVREIAKGNAEKKGKKSITISVTPDMLEDTTSDGKKKENNFAAADLLLALSSGLDLEKKNKNKTEVQLFKEKMDLVFGVLSERKDNYGFYWDYYVPYFVEMKNKQLVETFSYVAFSSTGDPEVMKWLKAHPKEIEDLYNWSKTFSWKKL